MTFTVYTSKGRLHSVNTSRRNEVGFFLTAYLQADERATIIVHEVDDHGHDISLCNHVCDN